MALKRQHWQLGLAVATLAAGGLLMTSKCGRNESAVPPPSPARPVRTTVHAAVSQDPAEWGRAFEEQRPPPEHLTADPAVDTGVLENGLRYVVMEQSPEAAGQVSLRLLVRAGSIHEADDERGVAHFVEHLAFRGGTRLRDEHALEFFQRCGLAAGADSNAFTGFDHTLYQLDLPGSDDRTLAHALDFLRDVADGLGFRPDRVEEERQVVLRELAEREKATAKWQDQIDAILPGHLACGRLPIGTREVLATVSAARLGNFWRKHYVPRRMVLIVAGDLDRAEMVQRIRAGFASVPDRPVPPEPDLHAPATGTGVTVRVLPGDGGTTAALTLAVAQGPVVAGDGLARRREELLGRLGRELLGNRLSRRFQRRDGAVRVDRPSAPELLPGVGWWEFSAIMEPQRVEAMLVALVREWRNAKELGFDELEFAEAVGELRREARRRLMVRLGRSVSSLADAIAADVLKDRVIETPEDEFNRTRASLATVTRQECEAVVRAGWERDRLMVMLTNGGEQATPERVGQLAKLGFETRCAGPPPVAAPPPLVIEPPGAPGVIARRALDGEHGYVEAEWANRALARLKPIPGLGGSVIVQVRVGAGAMGASPDATGVIPAADLLGNWHPLAGWGQQTLRAALTGEEVSVHFSVGNDAFTFTGCCCRETLRRQLDLLCACLHRPGIGALPEPWRPGAFELAWEREWQDRAGRSLAAVIGRALTNEDPRLAVAPPGLADTDGDQVAAWLLPQFRDDRLCVTVVGDFAPEEALGELAGNFGALPQRQPWRDECDAPPPALPLPGVRGIAAPRVAVSAAVVAFLVPDCRTAEASADLQIATGLLKNRMFAELRQRAGLSYSPAIWLRPVPATDRQWLELRVPCAAGTEADVAARLRQLLADLRDRGWTEDETVRATRPLEHVWRHALRDPMQCLEWLKHPAAQPVAGDPAAPRQRQAAVRQWLRQHLDPAQALELRLRAEEPEVEHGGR